MIKKRTTPRKSKNAKPVDKEFILKNYETMSAGDIAKKLGVTRNTVIGCASRAGLKKGKPAPKPKTTAPARRIYGAKNISNLSKTMMDLKPKQCRAPLEDDTWCCEKTVDYKPYCQAHIDIFYMGKGIKKTPRTSFYTPLEHKAV